MSAKGLKAIVRTMRDDKREKMPGLLLEAMAEELPPEGDDARLQGKARRRQHQGGSRGVRTRRAVVSTNRQGACIRARRDGRSGAPKVHVLGTEGTARPRDARPTRHPRRFSPSSVTCPPGDSTATSRDIAWLHEARRPDDPIAEQLPCPPHRLTWRQRVAAPYPFHPELAVSG